MPSIYQSVLGKHFKELGPPLQRFLEGAEDVSATGSFAVSRREGLLGWILGLCAGFPASGTHVPVRLRVFRSLAQETWRREIGREVLQTRMAPGNDEMIETAGITKIHLKIAVENGCLIHQSGKVAILGVPLPQILSPRVSVIGTPRDSGWIVNVRIAFPIVGQVLAYEGFVRQDE